MYNRKVSIEMRPISFSTAAFHGAKDYTQPRRTIVGETQLASMLDRLGIALDADLRSGVADLTEEDGGLPWPALHLEVRRTAANRGLGAEETRKQILDAAERVFFKTGHAKVTHRAVAATAGVTPGLVQYYFSTIDDLFAAMIGRLIERDAARWSEGLDSRPDEPLRVLWEYSWGEAAGAFGTEMMSLGTRRPSLLKLISDGTERIREIQLRALETKYSTLTFLDETFPLDAMVLLVTSIPKVLTLEEGVQVKMAHRSLIAAFERYLDTVEPKPDGPAR